MIFAAIFKGTTIVDGRRIAITTFYVPAIMTLGIISASYVNLTQAVVAQRESGELKRLRGTPLPASFVITSRAAVGVVVAVVMSAHLRRVHPRQPDPQVPARRREHLSHPAPLPGSPGAGRPHPQRGHLSHRPADRRRVGRRRPAHRRTHIPVLTTRRLSHGPERTVGHRPEWRACAVGRDGQMALCARRPRAAGCWLRSSSPLAGGKGCRLPVACLSDSMASLRQASRVSIDERASLSVIPSLAGRDRAAADRRHRAPAR